MIASRAHKQALAIHRTFVSRDINLLVGLYAYKVYVRPLVQHNSVILSPSSLQVIIVIEATERVQRRFTKTLRTKRTKYV